MSAFKMSPFRACWCLLSTNFCDFSTDVPGDLALKNGEDLSGQAIRTPTFADSHESIDSQERPIFEALGQIHANGVLSPIRIEIRVIRTLSSLLSIFWNFESQNKLFFSKRESIRRDQGRKNHDSHRRDRIWRDFLHWIFRYFLQILGGSSY